MCRVSHTLLIVLLGESFPIKEVIVCMNQVDNDIINPHFIESCIKLALKPKPAERTHRHVYGAFRLRELRIFVHATWVATQKTSTSRRRLMQNDGSLNVLTGKGAQ